MCCDCVVGIGMVGLWGGEGRGGAPAANLHLTEEVRWFDCVVDGWLGWSVGRWGDSVSTNMRLIAALYSLCLNVRHASNHHSPCVLCE